MNGNPRANGSRGRDPYAALRLVALIAAITGVIVLAAAAFVLSYGGIHRIALSAGVSASMARIFPVIFDAMLVVSCAAVLSLRTASWWPRTYAWLTTLVLLAAVAAADAVHATGTHIPRKPAAATIAVLPWVLLLVAFSLLLSMLRHFRRTRAAWASEDVAESAGLAAPHAPESTATQSPGAEHAGAGHTGAGHTGAGHTGAGHTGAENTAVENTGAEHTGAEPTGPGTTGPADPARAGLDILEWRRLSPQPAPARTAAQPGAARTATGTVPAARLPHSPAPEPAAQWPGAPPPATPPPGAASPPKAGDSSGPEPGPAAGPGAAPRTNGSRPAAAEEQPQRTPLSPTRPPGGPEQGEVPPEPPAGLITGQDCAATSPSAATSPGSGSRAETARRGGLDRKWTKTQSANLPLSASAIIERSCVSATALTAATAARAMVSRPIVHEVASRSRSSLGASPAARPPGSFATGPPVVLITGPSLAAGHRWSRPRVWIFTEADCPRRIASN